MKRLPVKIQRIVRVLQLKDVYGLARFSERDLRALPRIGNEAIAIIEKRLRARGLRLKKYEPGKYPPVPKVILEACPIVRAELDGGSFEYVNGVRTWKPLRKKR